MSFKLFSDRNRYYPSNSEILTAFGLRPGQHLPDEFRSITWMGSDKDGVMTEIEVVLLPKADARLYHPRSTKPRRIHAICPNCKRLVCAGHTVQHKCRS